MAAASMVTQKLGQTSCVLLENNARFELSEPSLDGDENNGQSKRSKKHFQTFSYHHQCGSCR